MIADAVDTLRTLGWALAAWIILTAAAATCALYTALTVAWFTMRATVKATGRASAWLCARLPASNTSHALRELRSAPEASQGPPRPAPSWARTDHHHKEAA